MAAQNRLLTRFAKCTRQGMHYYKAGLALLPFATYIRTYQFKLRIDFSLKCIIIAVKSFLSGKRTFGIPWIITPFTVRLSYGMHTLDPQQVNRVM